MDLLNGKISNLYFKYLAAAFGSTLMMSIYTLVDTIVVGHYEGPDGSAASATIMPIMVPMFALGMLFGIGGAVYMAQKRGAGDKEEGDRYFTVAIATGVIAAIIIFVAYVFALEPLLYAFGARDHVMELAKEYAIWIALFSPSFIIAQVLVPFIRNDGHPLWTTVSVVIGGVFNIFGDIYFVFGLDMGIKGAGIATGVAQLISFLILLCYLPSKKCTLSFRKEVLRNGFGARLKDIATMGLGVFVIDIAMGVLSVIFNNQTMLFGGATALALYGIISSFASIVQTLGYAIGESAQAIMSINFGAGQMKRVNETYALSCVVALALGIVACLAGILWPDLIVKAYTDATPEVLEAGRLAIPLYFTAFIPLVFNVNSTYYFQSVSRPRVSTAISLLRGIIISGVLLFALPAAFGLTGLWIAIPVTELTVAVFVVVSRRRRRQP